MFFLFNQKLFEKSYFIVKMNGPAIIWPASSDFWTLESDFVESYHTLVCETSKIRLPTPPPPSTSVFSMMCPLHKLISCHMQTCILPSDSLRLGSSGYLNRWLNLHRLCQWPYDSKAPLLYLVTLGTAMVRISALHAIPTASLVSVSFWHFRVCLRWWERQSATVRLHKDVLSNRSNNVELLRPCPHVAG